MYNSGNYVIDIGGVSSQDSRKTYGISYFQRYWRRLSRLQRALVIFLLCVIATGFVHVLILQQQALKQAERIHPRGRIYPIDLPSQRPFDSNPPAPPAKPVHPPLQTLGKNASREVAAIIAAFEHSWKAYKLYAWGEDEVHPLTHSSSTWMGAALTMVDALDTMKMMGLERQFKEARDYLEKHLSFDVNKDHVNVFETTIRLLGGLLSIYYLTNDRMFLEKAIDLGDRLLPAFDTPSSVPMSDINLGRRIAQNPAWSRFSSTAEVGTLSVEFLTLAKASGQKRFKTVIDKLSLRLHQEPKKDGLVPIYINVDTGSFQSTSTITLGARGDSYYEYLLKQWVLTNKTDDYLRRDYVTAIQGIKKHLLRRSQPKNLYFVGELTSGHSFYNKMDHLACFLPGTLAYGVMHGMPEDHVGIAEKLMETCYEMYRQMPTGLSPEIAHFNLDGSEKTDIYVKPLDKHNLQRPETVESLFYLYRLTKKEKYREWGWKIFEAFEKHTKLPFAGYVSISDVTRPDNVRHRTKCESFWFSETLKYFFLLFSDSSALDLHKFVINTEAHPLPIG